LAFLVCLPPTTAAEIYHDLQTTNIERAQIDGSKLELRYFLMAFFYLWKYPTETDMEARFDYSAYWAREKTWGMIEKIRALKDDKIRWDEDLSKDDIWVLSVDGIHCWIKEPKHPVWSQDRKYYSHKYGKAGLMYELGICLSTNRLLWMRGPFPAGTSDTTVARKEGLVAKLRRLGGKAIGDRGYNGQPNEISTPNAHDNKGVQLFKRRALMRQENFNGLIKNFDITNKRFNRNHQRFEVAFEAVCVLCQYKIEIETPLYDILIEDVKKRFEADSTASY